MDEEDDGYDSGETVEGRVLADVLDELYFMFKNAIAEGTFEDLFGELDELVGRGRGIEISGRDTLLTRPDFEKVADRIRQDSIVPVRPNPDKLTHDMPLEFLAIMDQARIEGDTNLHFDIFRF